MLPGSQPHVSFQGHNGKSEVNICGLLAVNSFPFLVKGMLSQAVRGQL